MVNASVIADLCIYILTWNVGTHSPRNQSMTDALSLNNTSMCPNEQLPDIYVIAMQEVITKNPLSRILQDSPWVLKVADYLLPYQYAKVETEQLQGLLIMMFSQFRHIPHIREIEAQSTRTGLGGLWGNKGAVSIRMSLYGTGVTFVNSHLAAHDKELKERIVDYNQIVDNHHYNVPKYRTIFDHDFVFWFGDLNFRLKGKVSAWDIHTMIENDDLDELYEQDQLKLVRESGNAFHLLQEPKIRFPPTFKFIEGTSEYDLNRRPAWCDRIMYRVQEEKHPFIKLSVTPLSYNSHPVYTLSDHKPVSAEFIYKIEAESETDDEIHEMTHGASETHYASVIIILLTTSLTLF